MKWLKQSRTFLPEILAPGTGLSPITDRSVIPANNIPTIQDVLMGKPYKIPGGGGDWSSERGEDGFKSYKEEGDDYKRKEKDLEILKNMIPGKPSPVEEWKVKVPGGSKTFISFENAQSYRKRMEGKGIPVKWIARTKMAQKEDLNRTQIVSDSLSKTFMVNTINVVENTKEIGSAFCIYEKHFITCAHAIHRYNKNIKKTIDISEISNNIRLVQNGKSHKAEIVAIDAAWDIAILKSDIDIDVFALDLFPEVGMGILSIGSPHGFENNISFGSIGSTNRKIYGYDGAPSYMFVDSSVFAGNSGGPVVSLETGGVVAMLTAIITTSGEYGLNAGLPSTYIEKFCIMNHVPIKRV